MNCLGVKLTNNLRYQLKADYPPNYFDKEKFKGFLDLKFKCFKNIPSLCQSEKKRRHVEIKY